ncbi:MFS transporter [Microvirga terrae]|uniref:MFS transporter n=1 Tax=Microvirga terrae TaxID=2740529 RepID=A0ABY5RYH5_9HYPH|nr:MULTISPECIES: MFS transporter [Microvirga]MBQ0821605.1 MFS transporter [Microvirga sp. HBU67558]UVF21237.1 MFS transporter [Microvirga terrae]
MTRQDLLPARLAASALFFGNGFGIGTWAAQLPRFKESLGLSDGQLSLGLLAFSLGAVALMPIIGWAVAVVGSRTMTVAAAFSFAAALMLPGLAPSLSLFVAAALVAGACNGTMDIAMNTNATVVEKAWGSAIMSSFHAFFSLGGLAGAGASGLLIALDVGIVPTLVISCLGMGLLFLPAAFWALGEKERPSEGHGFAWPRGSVILLAVLAMFCFIVEGAMVDWSAIYLQTVAGASLEAAVTGFAAFSLAMTVCRFMGDFVVRHLGRIRTLQLGGLLSAFGLALAMLLPQPLPASIGFALVGIGLANAVPVLFSAAGQMKDLPPSMGVAMVATLGYGGLLLGPPLIGFGGEIFSLRAMLGLLIGFAFIIIILSQRALQRSTVQFS